MALALVAAVVAAGYLHTLSYSFHFDDFSSIRDNPVLDRPGDLAALWSFRPSRVFLYLSLSLNAALTGRSVVGLRVVNLLIHIAASLLVGWIAAELGRRLSEGAARGVESGDPLAARARAGASGAAASAGGARETGRAARPEGVGLIAALLFAAHPDRKSVV